MVNVRYYIRNAMLLIAAIMMLTVAWFTYDVLDGMTPGGDRRRANPSQALIIKEEKWRKQLAATGRLIIAEKSGVMYCYSAKGAPPSLFSREVRELGYALDTVVGPYFAGSDFDWYIVTIDHNRRKVDVASFSELQFGTTDGSQQEGAQICGKQLALEIDRNRRSGQQQFKQLTIRIVK